MSLMSVHSVWWGIFFFFKQKTAYEILRSDWSSDVCSSDLPGRRAGLRRRDQYDEDLDHRRARGSPGRSFAADLRESLNGIWLVRSFADWPGSVGEVTRFSDRCSPTADDHFPGNRKPANQPTNPPPDPGRPRPANPLQ